MAKITDITEQKRDKKRVSVFLDGKFCCGISLETVYNFNLKIGDEISESDLAQIQFDSEKNTAYDKALTFISKSLKTKRQVKEHLVSKGYLDKTVDYCVTKLTEYNFINDYEYCASFVRTYKNQRGAKVIERDLRLKGIDFNLIDKAIDAEYDGGKDTATRIAEKYLKNKEMTKENYAKAYKYLLSKGFDYDEVSTALSSVWGDKWNEF